MSHQEKVPYAPAAASEVLRFQQQRIVTVLFTEVLMALEDLALEHDQALSKLNDALPDQYKTYVELADYLTPERSKQLRKRILDRGNHALRALEEISESFDIEFKT